MPTVPNWIAKGYLLDRADFRRPRAYRITRWRATRTQVVVSADGLNGEHRFTLEDLRGIGRSCQWMTLIPPDDPKVVEAESATIRRRAITDLRTVIDDNPLNDMDASAEDLALTIGRIQRAATESLAKLADLL